MGKNNFETGLWIRQSALALCHIGEVWTMSFLNYDFLKKLKLL